MATNDGLGGQAAADVEMSYENAGGCWEQEKATPQGEVVGGDADVPTCGGCLGRSRRSQGGQKACQEYQGRAKMAGYGISGDAFAQ